MRYSLILLLSLCACAAVSVPVLPGPADEVHCKVDRSGGAMEGTYECTVKGHYEMRRVGL